MYKIKLSNTKAYANPSDDPIYKQKQLLNHPEDKYDPLKYSVHYNTIQEENDKGEPDSPSHINRTQQLVDLSFNRLVKSSQSHIKSSVKFRNNESLSEGRNSFSKKSIQKERKEILEIKELNEYSESKEKGLVVIKEHLDQGRLSEYKMEEEDLICSRFPHLNFCSCSIQCNISLKDANPIEVYTNLFIGNLFTAYATKKLLKSGITHVLNLSSNEYTKRTKYFRYLSIEIFDSSDEDIKKHFRITNRFISDAINSSGKVLIHDIEGGSRAPAFALAYMISVSRIPLKQSIDKIKNKVELSINQYFMKQLEQYDLENLANVSSKKSLIKN